jgi:hypothetical protein
MADAPRIQQPYANTTVPMSYDKTNPMSVGADKAGKLPTGPRDSKMAQLELILQGLRGAR